MSEYNFTKMTAQGESIPGISSTLEHVGKLSNATIEGEPVGPLIVASDKQNNAYAAFEAEVKNAASNNTTANLSNLDSLNIDGFSSKTFSITKLMSKGTTLAQSGLSTLGKYAKSVFPGASATLNKFKGIFGGKNNTLEQVINKSSTSTSGNDYTQVITKLESADAEKYKCVVKSSINPSDKIFFKVTPTVDETRSANYDSFSPPQHPGGMQIYKSTTPRTINVNGKFISRTYEEATETLRMLNVIRAWTMPYYGTGTAESFNAKGKGNLLGLPPDVLIFSAYGSGNLENIPVVLQTYNWTYPEDIDYVYGAAPWKVDERPSVMEVTPSFMTLSGDDLVPVPRIIDVTLTFTETYSPDEFSSFDLNAYKLGKLSDAFKNRVK